MQNVGPITSPPKQSYWRIVTIGKLGLALTLSHLESFVEYFHSHPTRKIARGDLATTRVPRMVPWKVMPLEER